MFLKNRAAPWIYTFCPRMFSLSFLIFLLVLTPTSAWSAEGNTEAKQAFTEEEAILEVEPFDDAIAFDADATEAEAGSIDDDSSATEEVIFIPLAGAEEPLANPIVPVPVESPSEGLTSAVSREMAGPPLSRPVRGVWIEALASEMNSAESIDAMVHQLRDLNVDDIFVETIDYGMANCRSTQMPPAAGLEPDRLDPLALIIEAAHLPDKRKMRVHAVVNPLRAWTARLVIPMDEKHVIKTRPDWMARDVYGNDRDSSGCAFLCPAAPEVRTYLMGVVSDLVERYEIDGILFDEMRYPGLDTQWGYNPASIRQFQADTGSMDAEPAPEDPEWISWRASRLTGLLGALAQTARSRRNGLAVSATVIASGDPPGIADESRPEYEQALQFWPTWASEEVVDWLVLTNFHRQQTDQNRFLEWLLFSRRHKESCRMIVAVSGRINDDSAVMMQMRMALGRGLDGVLLHSYTNPSANTANAPKFLAYLGKTLFSPDYRVPYYAQDLADEKRHGTMWASTLASEPLSPDQLPAPVRLAEDEEPEPWESEPWPPKAAPKPSRRPRQVTQSDLARALLGLAETTERYAGQTEWGSDEDAISPDAAASFAPIDLDVDWKNITLLNGKQIVVEILSNDGRHTRFRRRGDNIIVSIANDRIRETAPFDENKKAKESETSG